MSKLITRASSINRALDQIGDKWCLLIIQEVFWGINSFTEMMAAMGVSRGVLSDRLKWLQSVDCLRQVPESEGGKRMRYQLTPKYQMSFNPQWDLNADEFRAVTGRVQRAFPDFVFNTLIRYDRIRDETTIGASINLAKF